MKATIEQIGTVRRNADGREEFWNWTFGGGDQAAIVYEDGEIVSVAGYSLPELREIAARRSEWEGAS